MKRTTNRVSGKMLKKSMMIAGFLAAASFVAAPAMADGYGYRYGYGHGYGYSNGYYGGGYGYRGHRRHHGHGAGKVLLGVGLGYLLFNGIHQSRRDRSYNRYDDRYYDRGPRYRRDVYQEPQRYEPPPVSNNANNQFGGADCIQIREYQTTIIIGGEEKDAYGDACLQPDGSWLQGPPKVVPNY